MFRVVLLLGVFVCLAFAQAVGIVSLRQRRAEGLATMVVLMLALASAAMAFEALGFRV